MTRSTARRGRWHAWVRSGLFVDVTGRYQTLRRRQASSIDRRLAPAGRDGARLAQPIDVAQLWVHRPAAPPATPGYRDARRFARRFRDCEPARCAGRPTGARSHRRPTCRRVWVRGHENVRKRVLLQAAACRMPTLGRWPRNVPGLEDAVVADEPGHRHTGHPHPATSGRAADAATSASPPLSMTMSRSRRSGICRGQVDQVGGGEQTPAELHQRIREARPELVGGDVVVGLPEGSRRASTAAAVTMPRPRPASSARRRRHRPRTAGTARAHRPLGSRRLERSPRSPDSRS